MQTLEQKRAYNREWRRRNPEKVAAWKKDERIRHREAYSARTRAWYRANKARAQATKRLKYYGLTPDAYDAKLAVQGNACEICQRPFSTTPNVDHHHVTGQVRDLLCPDCNRMLGCAREDVTVLKRAIAYLERWDTSK